MVIQRDQKLFQTYNQYPIQSSTHHTAIATTSKWLIYNPPLYGSYGIRALLLDFNNLAWFQFLWSTGCWLEPINNSTLTLILAGFTLHKYAHCIKSLYLGMLFMVTNIFNLDENFRKRKGVFTVLFSVTVQWCHCPVREVCCSCGLLELVWRTDVAH